MQLTVSRVLCYAVIYLRDTSLHRFSHRFGRRRANLTSHSGVASGGVYTAPVSPQGLVSSYLAFSPLPKNSAVIFCCTFLRVTPTRRYLAPCPVKLGLSSRTGLLLCARNRKVNCVVATRPFCLLCPVRAKARFRAVASNEHLMSKLFACEFSVNCAPLGTLSQKAQVAFWEPYAASPHALFFIVVGANRVRPLADVLIRKLNQKR